MSEASGKKRALLIVEDEPLVRQTLAVHLGEKFSVYEAVDGVEALTVLTMHDVDLVLTDLHMPRMDGLHLIQTIRQRWPQTRVVLCSRKPVQDTQQNIEALQIDALVEKPFAKEEVTKIIVRLLGKG